jgi:protein O-mannosyl-transferase
VPKILTDSSWRPPAILFAVVLLCYLTGLWNGFLWIDHSEIVQGAVRVTDLATLSESFLTADNTAGYHRPVYGLIHTLDHAIWGHSPAGYYLSSAVLHALNVTLLFRLLRRCRFDVVPAFAIAAVWGLHPANTAVAGLIHAKADLFGLTCVLISSHAFVRLGDTSHKNTVTWFVGLAAFAVGALTKESVFLLPVAMAVYVIANGPRRLWTFVAGIGIVALALGWLHLTATAGIEPRPAELALGQRVLTFLGVYLDYLRLLLLPLGLSMSDAVTPFSSQSAAAKTWIVIGFGLLVVGQLLVGRRWAPMRKWIFLFHLTLLPVSQLVPILHFRADRYLYLPSIAFVGAAVEVAMLVRVTHHRASATLGILVLTVFAALDVARMQDFSDDLTLFSAEVDHDPDYREGLSHLGRAYERAGQLAAAERCYRAALRGSPHSISYVDRDALLVNLTHNLAAQGRQADAFALAARHVGSIRSRRHRLELSYNQAVAAYNLDRYSDALPLLREYDRHHPDDPICLFLIGASAAKTGNVQLARDSLRRYLALGYRDETRNRDARRLLDPL